MKKCPDCKITKSLTNYSINRRKKDNLNIYCRSCCNKRTSNWRKNNKEKAYAQKNRHRRKYPEKDRNYMLKFRYGLSIEEYERLFNQQDRKCAICKTDKNDIKNFVVDHCHKSGKIRGILCSPCNRGLGIFKDNCELLNKVIEYLRNFNNDYLSIFT